jgi:hypothetical protein
MSYINPQRKVGSQSESPSMRLDANTNEMIVEGYQKFRLTRTGDVKFLGGTYDQKFRKILHFLKDQKSKKTDQSSISLADIGCSNGVVSFLGLQAGYDVIHPLDHDKACISMLIDLATWCDSQGKMHPKLYSFGDGILASDVVVAGAIVHWVYSCTSNFGSLDAIVGYLAKHTKQVLLIEWVSPEDPAIKKFKHLSFTKSCHKEPYDLKHFTAAMTKHFRSHKVLHRVKPTRHLYVAHVKNGESNGAQCEEQPSYKDVYPDIPFRVVQIKNETSRVLIGEKQIVIKEVVKYTQYNILEREVYWLQKFEEHHFDWAPKILHKSKSWFAMSYVGEPITKENVPRDWRSQCETILRDLESVNCRHNDIRSVEVLVKDGKLHLVDFGWASHGSDMSCGIGLNPTPKPEAVQNDLIGAIETKIHPKPPAQKPQTRRRNPNTVPVVSKPVVRKTGTRRLGATRRVPNTK